MFTKDFRLYYRELLVGRINCAFLSDGTWFGQFEPEPNSEKTGSGARASDFISFSVDWNDRLRRDQDNPPNTSEFDGFADVICDGCWRAISDVGEGDILIHKAPVFFPGGEVSFCEASAKSDRE